MTAPNQHSGNARASGRGWLFKAFWIWYVLSAALCVIAPEGRVFLGAIGMGAVWILVLYFRASLRGWVSMIPGPAWLRFLLVGLVFSDLIMENFAISFRGDLHKNLLVNSFLWLGTYLGWLAGWWLVSRLYQFTYQQVFFVAGATGILVEQNWMIPKLVAGLQLFPATVSAPILLVVYGAAVAPAFALAAPDEFPARPFGFTAILLGVCLPLALFLAVGHLWIATFRGMFGLS